MVSEQRHIEERSPGEAKTFVQRLAERLGAQGRAAIVYGEPIERDGVTVIPAVRARWAFGGGAGTSTDRAGGEGDGSGGGGIMLVSPAGFVEIQEGRATYRPAFDPMMVPITVVGGVMLGLLLAGMLGRRRR